MASAERLPFRDGWFDRVTMSLVLHLVDRPQALAEARRVVPDDGRIAISTFHPDHFETYWLQPFFPSIKTVDAARFPTPDEMERELTAAGFPRIEMRRLTAESELSREEALARIHGRHISTFDLLERRGDRGGHGPRRAGAAGAHRQPPRPAGRRRHGRADGRDGLPSGPSSRLRPSPFKPAQRGRKGATMTMQHSGRDAAKILLDAAAVERTLSRIAHELIERNADLDALALVGIHTRGVPLAYRLRALVEERSGVEVDIGAVDITFHRDDVLVRGGGPPLHAQPVVRGTELDFPLEGKTVVLVDDVLFSGRTIRAAIDALLEYGRPARVQLAVLVDRGHRELPIRPDYVGKNIPTALAERVRVELDETDDGDRVVLLGGGTDD